MVWHKSKDLRTSTSNKIFINIKHYLLSSVLTFLNLSFDNVMICFKFLILSLMINAIVNNLILSLVRKIQMKHINLVMYKLLSNVRGPVYLMYIYFY